MGTYYIPRNVKGETRLLYIFSIKSLITTAIGAFIGLLFYMLFMAIGLDTVGIIFVAVLAVIGFGIGAIKIPIIAGLPVTRKIGGESLDQIILNYIKFKKKRKLYVYTKEEIK